jgi:DNA-directed RNA polymerase specialized sigma subunit
MFNKWKQTGDVKHFQELYGSMKNMIHTAASRAAYGSNLPESAHKAYAAQAFLDALKTYNPSSGAALQTHVFGSVQNKVKRLNYMYSNLGHIPEPRMQAVGLYQTEQASMKAELGREPSAAELADRLNWNLSEVTKMQTELRKDLAMGEGTEEQSFFESSKDEEILDYIYYDIGPQEKAVYDYIFGKHGKPRKVKVKPNGKMTIDYDGIGLAMGMSSSKVRGIFQNIRQSLTKALKK